MVDNLLTNTNHSFSFFYSFSSAFGASGRSDQYGNGIDESIKQQALAEEEAAMNQYKVSTHLANSKQERRPHRFKVTLLSMRCMCKYLICLISM